MMSYYYYEALPLLPIPLLLWSYCSYSSISFYLSSPPPTFYLVINIPNYFTKHKVISEFYLLR